MSRSILGALITVLSQQKNDWFLHVFTEKPTEQATDGENVPTVSALLSARACERVLPLRTLSSHLARLYSLLVQSPSIPPSLPFHSCSNQPHPTTHPPLWLHPPADISYVHKVCCLLWAHIQGFPLCGCPSACNSVCESDGGDYFPGLAASQR